MELCRMSCWSKWRLVESSHIRRSRTERDIDTIHEDQDLDHQGADTSMLRRDGQNTGQSKSSHFVQHRSLTVRRSR